MSWFRILRLGAVALGTALPVTSLAAQDTPPRPMPPASPPPPTPAPAAVPVPPPANAVAVCNDQSFVLAPAQPTACASRGGVRLVLPAFRLAPPPAAVAPSGVPAASPVPAARRPDAPAPAGATMRCKDGTWLVGAVAASRCDGNGGLAMILPSPPAPPPAPAPPRAPR